jgi:hypothetical protein
MTHVSRWTLSRRRTEFSWHPTRHDTQVDCDDELDGTKSPKIRFVLIAAAQPAIRSISYYAYATPMC